MLPGAWEPLSADLSEWSGQRVVLSLVTDSDGPFNCDWACWGEPTLRKSLRNRNLSNRLEQHRDFVDFRSAKAFFRGAKYALVVDES